MIKHQFSFYLLWVLLGCLLSVNALSDDGFPGRIQYPSVKILTKEQLYSRLKNDKAVVVDVRSNYEYNTLKILNAVNIPVSSKNFPDKLKQLRASTNKAIVFYCNGRTCYKSYNAGIKAIKYNVKNCFSYDAGVFEWAQSYPDKAELLGKSPVNKEHIITKDKFTKRLLSPEEFEQKVLMDNTLVYDVRDREQRRGGSGLFVFRDKSVDLDNTKKLKRIVAKAIGNDSTLLFYDQKGKQVRWLQYFLEQQGLKKYYFMKGGAGAYYDMLKKQQLNSSL